MEALEEYPRSKAHSFLRIPELLKSTFQFLDPASNAVNARVCKTWSDIALECLWMDVDELLPLLNILAPMALVRGKENVYDFKQPPQVSDCQKFDKYAHKVRRLAYDGNELTSSSVMHSRVFDTLARMRLRLDVLPNLRGITWLGPLNPSIIFMHDRVREFAVLLPTDYLSLYFYFRDVVSRMPNLTVLDILSSDIPMSKIESDMVLMLPKLTRLKEVILPPYYLTGKVVETLSRLPELEQIEWDYNDVHGIGNKEDVVNFTPLLEEGAFPALEGLSAILGWKDASRLIGLPHFPAVDLTKLFLDSTFIESPNHTHDVLSVIANECTSLDSFCLFSPCNLSPVDLATLDEGMCMTFHTIQPLLSLHNIRSFELSQPFPLLLKQAELEVIASSWPDMEALRLNNDPVTRHHPTFTLEGLLPFAKHCTELRELGLFIDATHTDLQDPMVQFESLECLDVGLSPIQDVDAAALYLCQIIPPGCNIVQRITKERSSERLPEELLAATRKPSDLWAEVSVALRSLIQLRIRDCERLRLVEEELAELKKMVEFKKTAETSGIEVANSDN